MELGPHAAFIVTAYGAAMLVVAALIGWVALDRRALKNTLDDLEMHGMTRRSDRSRRTTA